VAACRFSPPYCCAILGLGAEVQATARVLRTCFPSSSLVVGRLGALATVSSPIRASLRGTVHDQPEVLGVVARGLLPAALLPVGYQLGRRREDLGVDQDLGAGRAASPVQGLSKRLWRDLTGSDGETRYKRTTGLEPATSSLGSSRSTR
jgi:hypothetical protein